MGGVKSEKSRKIFSNQIFYVFEHLNPKVLEYIRTNNGDIMIFEADKGDLINNIQFLTIFDNFSKGVPDTVPYKKP